MQKLLPASGGKLWLCSAEDDAGGGGSLCCTGMLLSCRGR